MADADLRLSDYVYTIKRNYPLIGLLFILIFGAVIAYALVVPPSYTVQSKVVFSTQDPVLALLGKTSSINVDMPTQLEIARSGQVLARAIRTYPDSFSVSVDTVKNSKIVIFTVTSLDPQVAAGAANMIADEFVLVSSSIRRSEAQNLTSLVTFQIEIYKDQIDSLSATLLEMKAKKNQTIDDKADQQRVQSQITALEKLYSSLLSRKDELSLSANEELSNVRVIEYAMVPDEPSHPIFLQTLLVGFLLAIFGSIGLAFLRDYFTDTYKAVREIEADVGPVFGTVAGFKQKDGPIPENAKEGIRHAKTSLGFHIKDGKQKLIGIASAQASDGKSLVARGLADSFKDLKVLLVDANLRSGSSNGKGLTDVLQGSIDAKACIIKGKHHDVLHSGTVSIEPLELFESGKMRDLISELKKSSYDLVLFDMPSFENAEALVLSSSLDGVVLVVAEGKTRRELVIRTKSSLAQAHTKLLGSIVTNASSL